MTVNERFIRLTSKIAIVGELKLGDDVECVIAGQHFIANVVKVENCDNQDGSMDLIYKLKSLTD